MRTRSLGSWIANAAAGLTGSYGTITNQAEQTGCSRQSVYDHTQKVVDAVEAQHSGGPTREQAIRENEALRRENVPLWEWLFQTIEFPLLKQQAELALNVFRPDGQLNDRAGAEEPIAWALSRLSDSQWSKVRGLLQAKEALTFLDLKRLYWNTRVFRGGKRKVLCPYEHLGLKLPRYDFWSLVELAMAPAFDKAKAKAKSQARAA